MDSERVMAVLTLAQAAVCVVCYAYREWRLRETMAVARPANETDDCKDCEWCSMTSEELDAALKLHAAGLSPLAADLGVKPIRTLTDANGNEQTFYARGSYSSPALRPVVVQEPQPSAEEVVMGWSPDKTINERYERIKNNRWESSESSPEPSGARTTTTGASTASISVVA